MTEREALDLIGLIIRKEGATRADTGQITTGGDVLDMIAQVLDTYAGMNVGLGSWILENLGHHKA